MTPRHLLAQFDGNHYPQSRYLHRNSECKISIKPKNRKYLIEIEIKYWCINGHLKLWKRDPTRFRLPIRIGGWRGHGDYITQENVHEFHWGNECPVYQAYDLIWLETGGDEE